MGVFSFYNGVIRYMRNKNIATADIKRCSAASLKNITTLLLRAFGYIVWPGGSDWLLDEADLEEGEARLVYMRGLGKDHPENLR